MCGFKCETTDREVYFTQFLRNLCACILTARICMYKCMIALMIATFYLGKVFITDTSMRGLNMLREKCRQLWVISQKTLCLVQLLSQQRYVMECYQYSSNKTTKFSNISLFNKRQFYYFSNCVRMIAFFTLLSCNLTR